MKDKNGKFRIALAALIIGSLTFVTAVQAGPEAGPLLSRQALQTLLGGPGTLEDFESFSIVTSDATGLDCAVLNSTAICNGQGPGLVVPGVVFTWGTGGGQWDGAGYYGSPSREILSGNPAGQPLIIDFEVPVDAFGVDLRAFTGFPATVTMTIFGTNDTTVLGTYTDISLLFGGDAVFAGWEDISGIGRVTLTQTGQAWSPIIDNLEFGNRATLDSDADGVPDASDDCPGTAIGAAVDTHGCSGEQLVDLACPCSGGWKNHGQYLSCVAHEAAQIRAGLLTEPQKDAIVSARAKNSCGK